MKLDGNNQSIFKLSYYLVLVIKYRRKVIDNSISTTVESPIEVVRKYIENQGMK